MKKFKVDFRFWKEKVFQSSAHCLAPPEAIVSWLNRFKTTFCSNSNEQSTVNNSALYFISKHVASNGREPWSSGYGWRLVFERSWVWIPAPYTEWTFFTLICCKNCISCLKKPKINEKDGGVAHFYIKHVAPICCSIYLSPFTSKLSLKQFK